MLLLMLLLLLLLFCVTDIHRVRKKEATVFSA